MTLRVGYLTEEQFIAIVKASLETSLGGTFEPVIATGTSAQYWRGDKTWQSLDKAAVGLTNVDNTSDVNKPVSTATQTALDLKAPKANPTFTGVATFADLSTGGIIDSGSKVARFQGSGASVPAGSSGAGVEMFRAGSTSYIESYNRTTSAYADMKLSAVNLYLGPSGANIVHITNTGLAFPFGLTNAADDTAAAGAGVAVGQLYRNGSVVMIRVV